MQNININIIFPLNILRYYTSTIEPCRQETRPWVGPLGPFAFAGGNLYGGLPTGPLVGVTTLGQVSTQLS